MVKKSEKILDNIVNMEIKCSRSIMKKGEICPKNGSGLLVKNTSILLERDLIYLL